MNLHSDIHATDLIHLLSIGLRILTFIEYQARKRLSEMDEKLSGIYAGNPKLAIALPTTEAMLQAFKGIYLSVVSIGDQVLCHVTLLLDVQAKFLSCWTYRRISIPNWPTISQNQFHNDRTMSKCLSKNARKSFITENTEFFNGFLGGLCAFSGLFFLVSTCSN